MKPGLEALDDTEVLDRMLARDESAWGEFHKRFDRLIWCGIHKATARFSRVFGRDDAREVYAVFLASLWSNDMRKLRSFDRTRGVRLSTWVTMLVTHAAVDHLRAFTRQPEWEPLSAAEDIPDPDDPFQWLSRREERDHLAALVETFAVPDKTFARTVFLDGEDPADAAVALGLSVRTVYTRKHRMRVRFEELLAALRFDTAA